MLSGDTVIWSSDDATRTGRDVQSFKPGRQVSSR